MRSTKLYTIGLQSGTSWVKKLKPDCNPDSQKGKIILHLQSYALPDKIIKGQNKVSPKYQLVFIVVLGDETLNLYSSWPSKRKKERDRKKLQSGWQY